MLASSVIKQLQNFMPQQTSYFNDTLAVSSLTRSGTTVTVVTTTPHGLSNGSYVNVSGALTPVLIDSLTSVGTTAAAVTDTNHDLTEVWNPTVQIVGADQAGYNGTFPLDTCVNRKNFTFQLPAPVAPTTATGTIYLVENFPYGYNGLQEVTVVNPTTFT